METKTQPETELATTSINTEGTASREATGLLNTQDQTNVVNNAVPCVCGAPMTQTKIANVIGSTDGPQCANTKCPNSSLTSGDGLCYHCPSCRFYYCNGCASAVSQSGFTSEEKSQPSAPIDFRSVTNDVSTLTQIQLMTWKNFQTQFKRRKKSFCCKMCCPITFILFMGIVGALRPVLKYNINCDPASEWDSSIVCGDLYFGEHEQHNAVNRYTYTSHNQWIPDFVCPEGSGGDWDEYGEYQWLQSDEPPAFVGIVYDHTDTTYKAHIDAVIDIIAQQYGEGEEYVQNDTTGFECNSFAGDGSLFTWTDGSLLKRFETTQELDEYIRDGNYAKSGYTLENDASNGALRPIAAAIEFKSVSSDGMIWDYALRFHDGEVPGTWSDNEYHIVDRESKDIDQMSWSTVDRYAESGFIGFQTMIDRAITEYVAVNVNGYTEYNTTYMDFMKGYFALPAPFTESDFFWTIMFWPFQIFSAIMFVYPVVQIISVLVSEKSSRIKEGMKMMGLSSTIYWVSMYLWFVVEFTLICVMVVFFAFLMNVFLYSNQWIILIWFWLFCLSQITFFTLLSTFFDNPKTATIVGFVLYFVLWAMYYPMSTFNQAQKEWFCLLAMPCYMDSIAVVVQYENALTGIQWDNIDEHTGQFSMRTALNMMFIDCVIYTLLTLYFDSVWPTRFGQRKSPFFCLTKAFWRSFGCCRGGKSGGYLSANIEKLKVMDEYEEICTLKNPAILVRDLSKTFAAGFGTHAVHAVREISLDIYDGEVFCLLGHNGAGKTTTISILAGLLSSTNGAAYINGYDLETNMNAIRKFLGVCPQHDILWDKMTVAEHLRFFAKLKGVQSTEIQHEINRVINLFDMLETGLWGKFPPTMSGGERRKLSLAIALIGGSQIVFLDEPTSGMDPENRRKVWDIIEQEKKNRCIILTTHYMEEADILGDRIAIMSSGQIKCCGSSLYLKRLYGVGYTFAVSLHPEVNLDDEKHSQIKPAIDNILTDIPGVETVSVAAAEILYKLPFESACKFGNVFVQLDEHREELNIETFGVSVTTLEEVFLKIGAHSDTTIDKTPEFNRQDTRMFDQPEFKLDNRNALWIFVMHIYAILYKRFWWSVRDFTGLICQIILPVGLVCIIFATMSKPLDLTTYELQLTPHQFQPEYTDPVVVPLSKLDPDIDYNYEEYDANNNDYYSTSNWTNVTNLYYTDDHQWPAFFAQSNMRNTFGHSVSYSIGDTSYGTDCLTRFSELAGDTITSRYASINYNNPPNCTRDFGEAIYDDYHKGKTPYFGFYFFPYALHDWRHWDMVNYESGGYYSDYNEFSPPPPQSEVLFGLNLTAYHALPIAYNTWNNWVLKNVYYRTAQINVYSHPLPMSRSVESGINTGVATGYAMMLIIAFALIPASSIYFVVNEKTVGTKHQQYVSGISIASYWVGTYASDILLGLPAASLVILFAYVFDVEPFTGDAAMPFWTSLMLFVASSIAASYLIYPFFKSPGKAQFVTIICNVLLGMIFTIIATVLAQVDQSTNEDFRQIVRVLPIFLLAENVLAISNKEFLNADKSHWHDDVVGRNLKLMAAEAAGYFALILLIEYASSFPSLLAKLGFVVDQPRKLMRLDEDVVAEQERIQRAVDPRTGEYNPAALEDTVVLAGLRKVYKGENKFSPYKPAVRDMHFGVKQGQIFGFLGVNGAGKTSTLQLLIGQNYPSAGAGYIAGKSIVSEQLAIRRNIGFCPQNDALFDLLTGYEHLKFYAIIKGLSGEELNQQIGVLLNALTLNKYRKKTATTYSGGNKRKLCVAQSMIGNPPIIFMDEPSTGMDPVSRRFMWKFINHTMAGRAVILTTHSMEECEALCDRVGIMVNGQLSCIGSPNYLKSKFGKGYQLDVTVSQLDEESNCIHDLLNEFNKTFPTTILQKNGNKLLLEIRPYDAEDDSKLAALGQMFSFVENIKARFHIVSYALSQTSLEQVFLKMAEAKGETDEEDKITAQQQHLLKTIKSETKEDLLKRIAVLNRDYLEEILEKKIKHGSPFVVRAIAMEDAQ